MPNTVNFDEFKFDRASLKRSRAPGISAYMRIKNEQQLVRAAILSHIEHYDEIIACYNDCADNTARILHDLAAEHPDKIKVFHYLPKVHPPRTREHARMPDDSVHGLANYYNWALSKTTRQVAVKLDADHLGIAHKLSALTARIRRDLAAGRRKLYMASGINLLRDSSDPAAPPGVRINYLFCGHGDDFVYHPVDERAIYRNGTHFESFDSVFRLPLEVEYVGITFFHLRALKMTHHYRPPPRIIPMKLYNRLMKRRVESLNAGMPWEEFRRAKCQRELRRRLPAQLGFRRRLMYHLSAIAFLRKLKRRLTGSHVGLLREQLMRLEDDISDIDFDRDVLEPLSRWEGEAFDPDNAPSRHAGR